jgi:hypothetical protein
MIHRELYLAIGVIVTEVVYEITDPDMTGSL